MLKPLRSKKLSLKRDTVRNLTPVDLKQVGGARPRLTNTCALGCTGTSNRTVLC